MGKKNICEVCGGDSIGVAASSIGGHSNAYCAACLRKGWEPYTDIVGLCFATDIATVRHAIPLANIAFFGKTLYDVRAEAEAIMEEYISDMEMDGWEADIGLEEEPIVVDFSSGECGRCGDKLYDDNTTSCSCDKFE